MTHACHARGPGHGDAHDVSRDRDAGGGSGVAGDRPLSVLVADDSAELRRATIDLVGSHDDFVVVAEAESADGAIAEAARHCPDIAVLDVQMPGGGGPEAAKRIRAAAPTTIVVAHSAFDDAASRDAMERAGAIAYVVKGRDALLDVLHRLRASA
jgi:DNA-binding NarL/FixJ family response regulator